MAMKLTDRQQAVVDDRGGSLLVSAAAGSGKTRVLVERLMGYIAQGEDIDRFLVITFTNAAAAELRQRIAGAIHARLAEDPADRHLRRNATLVYKAPICTIDAFCMDLLRQWGHLADLDPDFRLCDQAEGEELRAQALREVLERRYENIARDPAFESLVDSLAGERDDQTLEEVILDMHRRVQAQADPIRWLEGRREDFVFPADAGPEDTPWGRLLLDDGVELVNYWLTELDHLREQAGGDPVVDANYGPTLERTMAGLEAFADALKEGWEKAAACPPVSFDRPGGKRGDCDAALRDRVKAVRERCKKQITDLRARFEVSGAEAMEDLRSIAPSMTALLDVTAEFDRAFGALKRRRRLVDFADGEHIAARLLAGEDGAPTHLARELGGSFVEIMVDEYQDTNEVQNTIFNALSNGQNLFLVGDVKQSIYRFRLADPTIFLDKYARFKPHGEATDGEERKILLSRNFRSRPEVLDGVNFIFKNVMTRQAGELDYTQAESLRPGREDLTPDPTYQVELNCVDLSGEEDDEEKVPKDAVLAEQVARRIRELLDGGMAIGNGPVRAEDMVILLRSPGPVLRYYAAALDALNIPWSAEGGYEFFGTTEISVAISLLHIVDNPRQDVPLLAVLRSPLYGFTPDRLARLRSGSYGDVYDSLLAARDRGEADCVSFLAELEELRDLAAEVSSHVLLWHIYERTHATAVFAAMPDGERRRANLMALYDEACRFERGGHRGLMAFLLHLSRMADNGIAVPVAAGEGTGGVRILSIHRSKGLEFPVVFLCGLERRFNESDISSTILFHPQLGLGPKRTDRSRMLRYTTIARDAVALRLKRQLRAEEMRLLYVAMTRAEHKLILFAAVNTTGISLKNLARQAQCPPSPRLMASASSMAEWVLIPALCRPDSAPLWQGLAEERPAPARGLYGWDIRLVKGTAGEWLPADEGPLVTPSRLTVTEGLAERLNRTYPYERAVDVHSKLTATQLKGREKDREAAEDGAEPRQLYREHTMRPPCFTGERPLTSAQKGTALHLAMQYLDFGRTGSLEDIREEIARLVAGQYITPQQGAAVEPERILAFFRSDLGRRMLAAEELEREFKFSMLVSAADYYPEMEGLEDTVLLQGVVDCWFREGDGTVTVVDFKTDRVTPTTLPARAAEYRGQLHAYTRALEQVMDTVVGRRYLWFFAVNEGVEM